MTRCRPAILPLFVGMCLLSLLPFFVTGCYRLTFVTPMVVLAAEGLCWIEETIRRRRYLPLMGTAVLIGAVVAGIQLRPQDPWILMGLLVLAVSAAWAQRRATPSAGAQPVT